MRHTIIIAIALFIGIFSAYGQNTNGKTYGREGDTFVQQKGRSTRASKDESTAYKWKDSKGNEYPLYIHTYTKGEKAGRTTCYVLKTSAKTGKEYKYYIPNGEEIAEEILKENL